MGAIPYFNRVVVDGANVTGAIASIDIPDGFRFLKVWACYEADRYGTAVECALDFYGKAGGKVDLTLPALVKLNANTHFGLVPSPQSMCNVALPTYSFGRDYTPPRMLPSWAMNFVANDSNNNQTWITPFDIPIECSRVVLRTDNPLQVSGVNSKTFAFLGVFAFPGIPIEPVNQ